MLLRSNYEYTDEDIEILRNDLSMEHWGSIDLAMLAGEVGETEKWELPGGEFLEIEELGTVQMKDVFRLFPALKTRNPKRDTI